MGTLDGIRFSTLTGDETVDLPAFDDPPGDPLALFCEWVHGAQRHSISEPAAFTLATADGSGRVSSRTLVLLDCDDRGLIFGTHLSSRKAHDLEQNARASATFYWRETMQQINVAGRVEQLGDPESDGLFAHRPATARAAAVVSRCGDELDDEIDLARQAQALLAADDHISRPESWAGFVLVPDSMEFWHGRTSRLHRRVHYEREHGAWTHHRLQP
jgi:pyridoxamine-phosphate oxidase